ncbi:MAG: hypothetical protein HGA45_00965 [Chloroflexales bacterium]|nr:hypothetical protein [Chloroflexales bacterium]
MTKLKLATWTLLALILAGSCSVGVNSTRAAVVPKGQQGCAAGTVVGGPNLLRNGNFSDTVNLQFESDLPNLGTGDDGMGIHPADFLGGGFSIQTGPKVYTEGTTVGRPFPGDPERDVPASQTYFYSNPNMDKNGQPLYGPGAPGYAMLWRQQVTGLAENTTYNFFAYFDNLLIPSIIWASDPKIELRVDGVVAGSTIRVSKDPDQWVPIQYSFATGPGQTSATLEIYDLANDIFGDDFGMTQINLKQCVSGLASSKYAYPVIYNSDGSFTVKYLFTVRNLGADLLGLRNVQIVDDLALAFAQAASFSDVRLESTTLSLNPGFNGNSDKNMLTGTDSLGPGATGTVLLSLKVMPGSGEAGRGPFPNSGRVSAQAGSLEVTDLTNPDILPDPNGNGNPKEPEEDAPTEVDFTFKLNLPMVRR